MDARLVSSGNSPGRGAVDHPRSERRDFLKKSILWGGAGLAGVGLATVPGPRRALASDGRARTKTFDVACIGETLRIIWAPGAPESGDLRGSTFSVEGLIYKGGAIKGSGFDPSSAPSVGLWLCRGWFLIHPGRPGRTS